MRLFCLLAAATVLQACSSVPEPKVTWYKFPKRAYLGVPDRPFSKLGQVRTRIAYSTLNFDVDENLLCKNYFNKAAVDLVKRAKEVGADAVIDVRSVVFQMDGKTQTFDSPECVDDGAEGQILAQGVAIKWKAGTSDTEDSEVSPSGLRRSGKPATQAASASEKVYAPSRQGKQAPASEDDLEAD
jgi:hypothetical protein